MSIEEVLNYRIKASLLTYETDQKFLDEYIQFFGKNALKNCYKTFTTEQQIERYTNNFIFWIKRTPKHTYKYYNEELVVFDNEDNIKWMIATTKVFYLLDKIKENNYIVLQSRKRKTKNTLSKVDKNFNFEKVILKKYEMIKIILLKK